MRLPVLLDSPALLPQELAASTQRAVDELLREGESQNTLASYRSALRYWAAWFALRYGVQITLPLPVPAVLQFIVDHAQRMTEARLTYELPASIDKALVDGGMKGKLGALSLNTIVHRVAVLSKAHQLHELKNPCHDAKVKDLLAKTRRAYAKRGDMPVKKDALTKEPLSLVLATCDDSLRGRRDRALLLFAWATGGRRRSEVAAADMALLKSGPEGTYIYHLAHSKTNQSGQERPEDYKPVTGLAALALREWLASAGIVDGRIFRQIRKGGHLGGPISPAAVRDIVQLRCRTAGIAGTFAAHSLRSGFVTEAGLQDVPLAETMAMTGHRSVQTVLGYTRHGQAQKSRASKLLD